MSKDITLTYMANYNGWEIESNDTQLTSKVILIIEDTLGPMSVGYCDEDGELMCDELPNETSIISEVQKMFPNYHINDIEYDWISS